MNRNTYNSRYKYYQLVMVSIVVFILAIMAFIVYVNFENIKKYIIYLNSNERNVTQTQKEFNELMYNVYIVEDLAKDFYHKEYQSKTAQFVSADYDDVTINSLLLDNPDVDFMNYILLNIDVENMPEINLKQENFEYYFVNPTLNEKIAFYEMMSVVEATLSGNEDIMNFATWGQNVFSVGTLIYNGSVNMDNLNDYYNIDSGMGITKTKMRATLDGVNIAKRVQATGCPLHATIYNYYNSTNEESRKSEFIQNIFGKGDFTNSELNQIAFEKLYNSAIYVDSVLSETEFDFKHFFEYDFFENENIVLASLQAFIDSVY